MYDVRGLERCLSGVEGGGCKAKFQFAFKFKFRTDTKNNFNSKFAIITNT